MNEQGIEVLESLPFFEYPCKWDEETHMIIELKEFGDRVYADLLSSINAEFGTSIPEKLPDFDEENAVMESYVEERTERYVVGSRKGIFEELQKHAESTDGNGYLCLMGDPGSGKSALLAKFYRDYTDYKLNPNHANHIVIPHFVGVSAGSSDIRKTLRRICHELKKSGIDDKIPEDYEELKKVFPVFLKKAAEKNHVVIIIDAINQFDTSNQALNMFWLPTELPKGVRIILSTLPGPALDALKKRSNPMENTLPLLKSSDANDIINEFLKRYRKNLEPEQRSALLDKEDAKTPLYLLIALEEIRTLGIYEEITSRIQELPGKVQPLFLKVLMRLENDDGFRDREGRKIGNELVRNFVSFIGVSRHGLSQTELVELIAPGDPLGNVAALQRLLRPYMMQRGELLDFYHNQLREAVNGEYLADEEECFESHKQLSIYFYKKADPSGDKSWNGNYSRGLSELPYHQTHAKMIEELENTLTDLMFIKAKFTVGMGYDLLADYNRVSTRNKAGSPIITARYYDSKYGVFCPFCLAWSKVEKSLLGKGMECPECNRKLVLNLFTTSAEWHPSKGELKITEEAHLEPQLSKEFNDYFEFVLGDLHILLKHPDLIIQQALNQPDDSPVAINAETLDNKGSWIKLINKPQKKSSCLLTLNKHTDSVNACSFSPDGKMIVSASSDKTLRIWDAETGEEIKVLRGHNDSVNACSFSPDGKRIVSASWHSTTLRIWDAETGEKIKVLRGHAGLENVCSFSPDGKRFLSAPYGDTLCICDVETGEVSKVLERDFGGVTACSFSPDGKRIVSASRDKTLRIWDVETGKEVQIVDNYYSEYACSFSPDGKRIVSASCFSATLRIWDAETGEKIRVLRGHTGSVNACSFSPDGKRIVSASSDKTLRIWDVESRTEDEFNVLRRHTSLVNACSFSPDGKRIVSGSVDHTFIIWDAETEEKCNLLIKRYGLVNAYSFSPDGKRIVSNSGGYDLLIRDAETGNVIGGMVRHDGPVNACSFSPDGKRIVSNSGGYDLLIRDAETGNVIGGMVRHDGPVNACSFSPDGKRVISASDDKTLRIWDAKTGEEMKILREIKVLRGHTGSVNACSFSPDGKRVVSASADETLRIWDAETGEEIKVLRGHNDSVDVCSFSPDGKRIVSASCFSATLRIWDAETGEVSKVLKGHTGSVNACSFSPDGKRIVSASSDKTLRIWDAETGEEIKVLNGHTDFVTACSFSPDGKRVVSASWDETLRIWDVITGSTLSIFVALSSLYCLGVAKEQKKIIAGDEGGNVYILLLNGLNPGIPFVTPIRLFLHDSQDWDSKLTVRCNFCGNSFIVEQSILYIINSFNFKPCKVDENITEFLDDPRLIIRCPTCNSKLRITHFFVDNKDSFKIKSEFPDKADKILRPGDVKNNDEPQIKFENRSKSKKPWWKFWD